MTPAEALKRLTGKLVGISDASIEHHVALWAQEIDALEAIRHEKRRGQGRLAAGAPVDADTRALMQTRIKDLDLKIEGVLAECIAEVEGELTMRGITWRPQWYLGTSGFVDGEFWAADRGNSINIPWYLANDRVWKNVNEPKVRYTKEDVMRVLRHECAHALGYAFELWKRDDWQAIFGDFTLPYKDSFEPDPTSTAYVKYLHETGPGPNVHYAQKHPDEDWAETVAVWMDPALDWRARYPAGTGARTKLDFVQWLLVDQAACVGEAPNDAVGLREPYQRMPGTVGEFVGGWAPSDLWSPASELLRREAHIAGEVALHELYFAGMGAETQRPAWANAAWEQRFRVACASSSSWAVTTRGGADYAGAPPAGTSPLIVCDLHEHAWFGDFPNRKDLYVAAFMRNIDWDVVSARLD
jgi:iron/manganese superoxide dismutase-like protein